MEYQMNNSKIEKLKELDRMFDNSEGKRIYDWMFILKKIEYTVNKNYEEFEKIVTEMGLNESQGLNEWGQSRPQVVGDYRKHHIKVARAL
jgi:hypothetical protein